MADTQFTEQIVREAPQIEAYKLGLLQSAKGLSDQPVGLPAYQVAGFGPDQLRSFDLGRQGIGAYQPYLYGGNEALQQGLGTTQEAADVLRGADTRNQYQAAQQAMNLSGQAANQMSGAAGMINPAYRGLTAASQYAMGSDTSGMFPSAYNFIGQGAGLTGLAAQQAATAGYQPGFGEAAAGTRQAQQQALGSSAADYSTAAGLMGAGVNQLYAGTGQYDPRSVEAYMNPYQSQVIQQALQEINRQAEIQGTQRNAQAVGAGAFGGSRQAITDAEANRNTQQLQNQTIANLMNQGYSQAQAQSQAAYEAGQQRNLASGQAIGQQASLAGQLATQQAQLGQAGAGLVGQLAGQQGQIAGQQGQLGLSQAGLTGQLGGQMGQFGTQTGQLAGQQSGIQQNIANLLQQQAATQGQLAGQQANIYGQQAGAYGSTGQGIGQLAGQQFGIGQQMAQGLGQFGAQLGNLGVQRAALGQSAQQLGQQDVGFLYNIGQQQQGFTQQQLDAQRNTALQQAYEPYQRLSFLSDIYKGAPSSQQSISAATAPTPSVFQQAAGLGISGLATAAGVKKAGLF
jgi:hypothetical protein